MRKPKETKKICITLKKHVLAAIDEYKPKKESRSAYISFILESIFKTKRSVIEFEYRQAKMALIHWETAAKMYNTEEDARVIFK